ncbi:MAG: peptidoglycan-binding protein [Pyrinomonadaceae bacterium]
MPESVKLEKAELRQLDAELKNEINPDKTCKVQFNPDTLKVAYANQIQTPQGAGDQKGTPARQFVGAGTTKLTLQLWFDVTQPASDGKPQETDVRKLTQKVAYFITPTQEGKNFVPPAVRFVWGSFQFDGLMESLDESLEFFSSDGRPLRASMTLNLSQQKITEFKFRDIPSAGPQQTPGTRPLAQAASGDTLQNMADGQGKGGDWQGIAAANGIENPRMLQPGQLLDLDASLSVGGSIGVGASVSVGASIGASADVSASVGFGASASVQTGGMVQTGVSVQADASVTF